MGRPVTPKSKAKTILWGALLDPKENKDAAKKVKASGLDKSKWLRQVILNAAEPVWLVSKKWGFDTLHGKSVEFQLTEENGRFVRGLGDFFVFKNRDQIRIGIEIHTGQARRITLLPEHAEHIERNKSGAPAEFRCFVEVAGLPVLD